MSGWIGSKLHWIKEDCSDIRTILHETTGVIKEKPLFTAVRVAIKETLQMWG